MSETFNGNSLRSKRKELRITQRELAEAVGVALITISRYERSERIPDSNILSKIVEKFNCRYDDLFI
jgi:transcriptional regulator with XRE-family HTH domain